MYEYSTEGLVADAVPVSGAFVAPCGLRGGRAWDLTSDLQTLPRLWVGVLGSWMRRTKHIFVSNMEGCTVRFTAVHSVHMRRMVGSLRSRAPAPVSGVVRTISVNETVYRQCTSHELTV